MFSRVLFIPSIVIPLKYEKINELFVIILLFPIIGKGLPYTFISPEGMYSIITVPFSYLVEV